MMRLGLTVSLAVGLSALMAQAQTSPVIVLPDPELPAGQMPEKPVPDGVPQPVVPPGTVAVEPARGPVVLPPPERDRAPEPEAAAPQVADGWLMPIGPADPALPREVRVGASLPSPGILRLTGETARVPMRLILPAGAALPDRLVLTLQSSVNLLPETARLRLSVNGGTPAELLLQNLRGFGAVEVPVTGLVAGENLLEIQVIQPHRIFCGPDASFGVWTEIDLLNSGAPLGATALEAGAEGFAMALQAQALRGAAIDVLAASDTPPAVLRAVTALLADTLGGSAPVAVRSFYLARPSAAAAVAVIQSDAPRVSFRRGASGTLVMQVEYTADAVPNLTGLLPSMPAMAPAALPVLTAGQETRFADLGQGDIIGNTHYFRADLPFRLADDWLLLANQKGAMQLRYGFADGLPRGGILLVKVNGTTVRLLPLDRDGGKVLPPLDIGFPTNLLRPGPNALSFEMIVPGDPPDAACAPRRSDMLAILGDSTLLVPPSPRMQEAGARVALRNLSRDGIATLPGAADAARADAAAVVLSALLAPVPNGDGGSRLTVIGLQDGAQVPLAPLGITSAQLRGALFAAPVPVAMADAAAPVRTTPAFRLSEEEEAAPAPAAQPGVLQRLWSGLGDQLTERGWVARQYRRLMAAALPGSDQSLPDWLDTRAGTARALLLQPDPAAPGDLWLVLAPDADPVQVANATAGLRSAGLARGEVALLAADGSWQMWSSGRMPALLEPLGPDNLRAVIGNYASWSTYAFSLVLLVLALVSTLPVLLYVVLTRRYKGAR